MTKNKDKILKVPFGTATNKLKKLIMFDLIKQLNQNICFRCQQPIITVDEFTIDHKESWLTNPDKFWDLTNIAFSHTTCNYGASRKGKLSAHGTANRYRYGCHCEKCKEANRLYKKSWRDSKNERN